MDITVVKTILMGCIVINTAIVANDLHKGPMNASVIDHLLHAFRYGFFAYWASVGVFSLQ